MCPTEGFPLALPKKFAHEMRGLFCCLLWYNKTIMYEDIDPNVLAQKIYDNPQLEEIINGNTATKNKFAGKGSYHNSSERGKQGLSGEDAACDYLLAQGYKIEQRNYRCYIGEIDIIASRNGRLHFVEVKTRSSLLYGTPREAVTVTKQRKIRRCAESFLKMTGMLGKMPMLSFDVIEVIRSRGIIKSLNHLEHCF